MNFRPINEVPEIEALNEGDKLLVNSNGTARQIDAEKVNPILKAPEAEELTEGDKILVNSGGNIVKVDASKIGGKGGGSLGKIYITIPEDYSGGDPATLPAYADKERLTNMSYAEGKALIEGGCLVVANMEGMDAYFYPMMAACMDDQKIGAVGLFMMTNMLMAMLIFSDTAMGD
ncbi:MAG: hypothetical protein J6M47_02550 [Clostridia bacterium]|nr:hypothetical protein [Clostridia bacterium]